MEKTKKDINLQVRLLEKFGKAVSSDKLCDQPKVQPWLVGHHPVVPESNLTNTVIDQVTSQSSGDI